IPATIAVGAFTFTMTALPGTPALQNAIPMPYFQTTPFAAPGLGVLAGLIMLGWGVGWLLYRQRIAAGHGETYSAQDEATPTSAGTPDKALRPLAQGEGFDLVEVGGVQEINPPPAHWAILPIVLMVGLNYLFSSVLFPKL